MARYCGNCGAMLDDDARVCGWCGTPVDGADAGFRAPKPENPEAKKKTKKLVIGILVAVVLIAAAIAALKIVTQYTGYRGFTRKVMAEFVDYDIEELVDMSSDIFFFSDDDDWTEFYFENQVGPKLDQLEEKVGHSYHTSYKIKDAYVVSERKMDDILDQAISDSDFDPESITKIAISEVVLTAKQGKTSYNQNIEIIMTKEDGQWRLLYIN